MPEGKVEPEINWTDFAGFIGCRSFPIIDVVRDAVSVTRKAFDDLVTCKGPGQTLKCWDLAVVHVLWHQQFAIGARCSRHLYIQLSEVSKSGLVNYRDKDYPDGYKTKLVWIPQSVREQMAYIETRGYTIEKGPMGRPRHTPLPTLQFRVDSTKGVHGPSESVTRNGILRIGGPLLPFPINTPRRVMRFMLQSRGLSAEYVDAFMGHWREWREPWSKWSSFDYSDYLQRIQTIVPEILSDLGFTTAFKQTEER